MEYLVTGKEMAEYDRQTIEKVGIPALVLMERAALAVYEEILAAVTGANRVIILAGCGNNGADGLALARMLAEHTGRETSFEVEVVMCKDPEKATPQWKAQKAILKHFPIRTGSKPENTEYDILIDALFGVGLSREIGEEDAAKIKWFNEAKGYKVAVDIPSGINSDTGKVMGCAVKADLTVSFAFGKRGLYFYPGCEYAGKVVVRNIGIGEAVLEKTLPGMFCLTEPVSRLLPKRAEDGNKGTFGKVLIGAGGPDMAGAAIMAARSCYRSGAGMVKILTAPVNRSIVQSAVPEALFTEEAGKRDMDWPDILVIGPGLGTDEWAYQMLRVFLETEKLPLIIDADALNLLGLHPELLEMVKRQGRAGRTIILTPHVGELSRLTGLPIHQIKEDPAQIVLGVAEKLHCIIVSKDARTLICQEGKPICMNVTGNNGMATAGSGDVLTGVIAGMLAQGLPGFVGAYTGVYLHGLAGDYAAGKWGKRAMTASDLIQGMIEVTKDI